MPDELHNGASALIEELIARAGGDFAVPEKTEHEIVVNADGTISMPEVRTQEWKEVALAIAPDYLELTQLDAAKDALIQEVDALGDDESARPRAGPYIDVLVARYFELAGGVEWDETALESAIEELRGFATASDLTAELFSPIAGLQDDFGTIGIAEGVSLTP